MNITKLIERTSTNKYKFDINNKEIYVGDIVIVISNFCLEKAIVSGITNNGLKLILLNTYSPREIMYYNHQMIKVNNLFSKEELSAFEELRKNFLDKKLNKLANRITSKQVIYAFHDKDSKKYGMMVGTVKSLPGKNIGKAEYENYNKKLKEEYPFIDFYPISISNGTFGECGKVPINSIVLDKTYDTYDFYNYEKILSNEGRYYYIFDFYNMSGFRFVKHLESDLKHEIVIFPGKSYTKYTKRYDTIHMIIQKTIDFIEEKMHGN